MRLAGLSKYCLLVLMLVVSWSVDPAGQQTAPSGAAKATLYEGARLIVGDGTDPIERSAFLVENGRFTQVGRAGEVKAPAGVVRVDLTGKTVMPALIDGHSHLGYSNVRTGTQSLENYTRDNLIEALYRCAYYGVGMTVSGGNDGGHGDLPWKMRDEEIPDAARWRTMGPGISTPGGGQGGVRAKSWTTVTTAEEARKAVQALAPYKPVAVKIWVDDRFRTVQWMPPELYRPVIEEAHKLGLKVSAHITYLKDAKMLVRDGVDGFEHSVRDEDGVTEVDNEFIELLRKRPGIWMKPLIADGPFDKEEVAFRAETLPPSQVAKITVPKPGTPLSARRISELRNLAKLNASGVIRSGVLKIGMGTDGGLGWASHTELEDMVLGGMTPAQVIMAATRTNAEIIGEADRLGSVATGRSADFIVLDANPLENIRNTRKINRVFMRGKEVDRAALKQKLTAEGGATQ